MLLDLLALLYSLKTRTSSVCLQVRVPMTDVKGGGSYKLNVAPVFLGWTNKSEHAMANEAGCAVSTKYPTFPLPKLL